MNHYLVEVALLFDDPADGELADLFERIADAAADITGDDHGPLDGDVGCLGAEHRIEIAIGLSDTDDDRAFLRGMAAVRTIIHAAGGPTGGWEKIITMREQQLA